MSKLNDVLKELHDEVGVDLVQTSVCSQEGFAIATETTITDNEMTELLTGRIALVQGAGRRIVEKLKLGEYQELIGSTAKIYMITRTIGDGSYYITFSATRKATLGTIRMLVEEYSQKIWDAIPR